MAANNPLSPDHEPMWQDLSEFELLKEHLATLKRKTQLGEIQAVQEAIFALAKNTSNADVAQYYVDLIRQVPLEDKKRILRCVRNLPPFPDATILLELARDKVLGYSALGALVATTDPRAEATARELLQAGKNEFAAAEALRELATAESAPALVQVITSTKNNFVRRSCLAALRKADGARHVNLFAEIYGEAHVEEVRWHCLVALRDFGKGEGIDAVVARLTKIAKKKGRSEPYTGGGLIAPKDIVAIVHRSEESYASEFMLGVEYLHRLRAPEGEAFFNTLKRYSHNLLDSEREFLAAKGLLGG